MSSKSRRRITVAVGATIAVAAIPVAAAFNAWANTEITYDGIVLYDDFDLHHPFLSSDIGTAAESGTNNDWAIVSGPASYGSFVGLANDSAATDSNDFAFFSGTTAPTSPFGLTGLEGATLVNATNSSAIATGGGNAVINNPAVYGVADPVSNSSAYATNGGLAVIVNDGLAPPGVAVTGDYADANGTASGTLLNGTTGTTPSIANIYDSGFSDAIANNTGTNELTGNGGAAVDLANNSFAEAVNPGSGANIVGTVTSAVTNSSNIEPDGDIFTLLTSNTAVFDGVPVATFFADLFGADGAATASADWTALLAFYGL